VRRKIKAINKKNFGDSGGKKIKFDKKYICLTCIVSHNFYNLSLQIILWASWAQVVWRKIKIINKTIFGYSGEKK